MDHHTLSALSLANIAPRRSAFIPRVDGLQCLAVVIGLVFR